MQIMEAALFGNVTNGRERVEEMQGDNSGVSRVGVLGGSFDPIHIGHLMAAEGAREVLQLSRVLFVPANVSPHKLENASSTCPAAERLEMARLAIENNPHFEVSDIEILRGGASYTVDTIEQLSSELGKSTDIILLVGEDSIAEMHLWKDVERLLDLCTVVPVTRPGVEPDYAALAECVGNDKAEAVRARTIEIPLVAVSSTEIRRRLRQGKSIRYQVPERIERYIREKDLYQEVRRMKDEV